MAPAVTMTPKPAMNCVVQKMPKRWYRDMYCNVSFHVMAISPVSELRSIVPLAYR